MEGANKIARVMYLKGGGKVFFMCIYIYIYICLAGWLQAEVSMQVTSRDACISHTCKTHFENRQQKETRRVKHF